MFNAMKIGVSFVTDVCWFSILDTLSLYIKQYIKNFFVGNGFNSYFFFLYLPVLFLIIISRFFDWWLRRGGIGPWIVFLWIRRNVGSFCCHRGLRSWRSRSRPILASIWPWRRGRCGRYFGLDWSAQIPFSRLLAPQLFFLPHFDQILSHFWALDPDILHHRFGSGFEFFLLATIIWVICPYFSSLKILKLYSYNFN